MLTCFNSLLFRICLYVFKLRASYSVLNVLNSAFLSCRPCLVTVAPSWRRWTRLKRCGCRSGNMKKTEHVPSTGRPSSRGWPPPPMPPELPSNTPFPSYCRRLSYSHLWSPGTSASSFIHSTASKLPPPAPPPRETHVWSFPFFCFPFAASSCSSRCWAQSEHSHSGAVRVSQRAAVCTVDSYYRPCSCYALVHVEVLVLLSCLQNPARCRISWNVNKPECFVFLPFQTEDVRYIVHFVIFLTFWHGSAEAEQTYYSCI